MFVMFFLCIFFLQTASPIYKPPRGSEEIMYHGNSFCCSSAWIFFLLPSVGFTLLVYPPPPNKKTPKINKWYLEQKCNKRRVKNLGNQRQRIFVSFCQSCSRTGLWFIIFYCVWTQHEGDLERKKEKPLETGILSTQAAQCVCLCVPLQMQTPLPGVGSSGGVERWPAVITGAEDAYSKLRSLQSRDAHPLFRPPALELTT